MSAITPGFSVVIPVYNGASYITDAINSCLQQTVLPDEIIVIDDASTDNTAEKVQGLHAGLVTYSVNDRNHGPSFSRNRGMKLAKYRWILFLDADDQFHPQKIEILQQCIQQQPQMKALGHASGLVSDAKQPTDNYLKSGKKIPLTQLSITGILLRNPMVTPSLAVLKSNKIFFNEEMIYAEDHDFILRTAESTGIWYLDVKLCFLHRLPLTSGGISSNRWKMRKGEMNMYISYCKRHGYYPAIPFLLFFSLCKHVKNMLHPAPKK